jgi:hypothetical protein
MVELKHDGLEFSFPEVHPNAALGVAFQRTLRIPDDGSDYRCHLASAPSRYPT